jgi:hypothetical protein
MRKSRSLQITDDAAYFLDNFEDILLREGRSSSFVEQFAYELFVVVFGKLSGGAWTDQAKFLGLDQFLPLHSHYRFTEGFVTGQYSANGDQVVLHSLALETSVPEALQRISVA